MNVIKWMAMDHFYLWKLQLQVCNLRAWGPSVRWLSAPLAQHTGCVGVSAGAASKEGLPWAGQARIVSEECWNCSAL